MRKRVFPRVKRRVNCNLHISGERYVGVARDLSPRGFFVQTNATPPIGAKVVVKLRGTSGDFEVEATVANRREIPRRLASVARGGIGCAVTTAPEDYFHFLWSISAPAPSA